MLQRLFFFSSSSRSLPLYVIDRRRLAGERLGIPDCCIEVLLAPSDDGEGKSPPHIQRSSAPIRCCDSQPVGVNDLVPREYKKNVGCNVDDMSLNEAAPHSARSCFATIIVL